MSQTIKILRSASNLPTTLAYGVPAVSFTGGGTKLFIGNNTNYASEITAEAGTLLGTVLNSTVVTSSLTSVGTLSSLTISGTTVLAGLTASTALALDTSNNVISVSNTGSGNNVLSASPTLTGTITAAALTASGLVTANASLTLGGTSQAINLNSATSNTIIYSANGIGTPAFTTRSVGTKIVYYPDISSSAADYAVGVANGTLWNSVPSNLTSKSFTWYGGTTQVASLDGTGNLSITGTVSCAALTLAASSVCLSNTNASYFATYDSTGDVFDWCIPCYSDNITYISYGSSGFKLRNNSNTSNPTLTIDNNGAVLKPLQPSFSAVKTSNSNNVTGDNTNYTVIYDTIQFDQANNYNNTTGVFTVHTSGKYVFSASVSFINQTSAISLGQVSLIASGNLYRGFYGNIWSIASGGTTLISCAWGPIEMASGDTAYIVVNAGTSTKTIGIQGSNYNCVFSGGLFC